MKLVDRDAERDAFTKLVALADPARVLMVRAPSGHGKSSLLTDFFDSCRYHDPPIAASLTNLDQVTDKSELALVQKIRSDLPHLAFDEFDRLNLARIGEDFSEFSAAAKGHVSRERADVSGGVVADNVGAVYQVVPGASLTVVQAGAAWTSERAEQARKDCLLAFLSDLRRVCADQTVVLIFDAHERAPELQTWVEELVLQCVLRSDVRCERLVVVIAGQTIPDFDRHINAPAVVRCIPRLSDFQHDHVKELLELHGVSPTPAATEYFAERLRTDLSISELLNHIDFLGRRSAT